MSSVQPDPSSPPATGSPPQDSDQRDLAADLDVNGPRDGLELTFTVAAVAARLGVAAPTLRTWDRRYGLGPSGHMAGSHRRYNGADIARLENMRRLTLEGVAPADAARLALRGPIGRAGDASATPPSERTEPDLPELLDPLSLAAAAVEADEARTRRLLHRAVRDGGLLAAWRTLVAPALDLLAEREHADRPGHDPEALLRSAMLATVRESTPAEPHLAPVRAQVSAYPSAHLHVDAHVLVGELARHGVSARVVRPRPDPAAPDEIVAALAAAGSQLAVLLGAPANEHSIARELLAEGLEVFVISLTAPALAVPGVHRARTLTGALHEMVSLLGAGEAADRRQSGG